ncbi:MAG: dimethylarginine dimethylaminohydrolase family protein [Bacteroidota bacterium]
MLKKAIVRRPCENMVKGISNEKQEAPNYSIALEQHDQYIQALEKCGLKITVLEKNNNFPDSVFIEDTAILTKEFATITNPTPKSRKEEIAGVIPTLKQQYNTIEFIATPGTLEGGDIMQVDNTFYIGRSSRSNDNGIRQFKKIITKHGYNAITVDMPAILHLKSGVSYLGNNILLIAEKLKDNPAFRSFKKIIAEEPEAHAANSLNINETILIPKECPSTFEKIKNEGYKVIELEITEFMKLDGGLSCMSLRS